MGFQKTVIFYYTRVVVVVKTILAPAAVDYFVWGIYYRMMDDATRDPPRRNLCKRHVHYQLKNHPGNKIFVCLFG